MHRLLQGEVGSGKTVVALRAMLAVVDAGRAGGAAGADRGARPAARPVAASPARPARRAAACSAAPTSGRGSRCSPARRARPPGAPALLEAASGDAGIVVGTHALLEETVQFPDLGLVVVDEQHRFGVEQRAALAAKGATPPHVLVMTATPIPRTVAMTVFGDLDVSTLTELPAGRQPITTHVVPAGEKPHFLERAWAPGARGGGRRAPGVRRLPADRRGRPGLRDRRLRGRGRPPAPAADDEWALWDPDDESAAAAGAPVAADGRGPGPGAGARRRTAGRPAAGGAARPDGRGRQGRRDARFAAGDVDVLVATTVVEVGVDVANATGMVVMDADRFGVSQLHQLRGRVGRGSAAGLCLLVTDLEPGTPGRARLDAVAATADGFELARVDLESRREGDVLGATQSGRRSSLRRLRVLQHEDVIQRARAEATALVDEDPDLSRPPRPGHGHRGVRRRGAVGVPGQVLTPSAASAEPRVGQWTAWARSSTASTSACATSSLHSRSSSSPRRRTAAGTSTSRPRATPTPSPSSARARSPTWT